MQVLRDTYEKQIHEPTRTNSRGFEALEVGVEDRNDLINKVIGNPTHPAGLGKEHRQVSPDCPDLTLCDDPEHIPFDGTMPISSEEIGNEEFESDIVKKKRSWSPFRRRENVEKPKERDDALQPESLSPGTQIAGDVNFSSSLPGRDTSGTPFLRIPSRIRSSRSRQRSRSPVTLQSELGSAQADGAQSPETYHAKTPSPLRPDFQRPNSSHSSDDEEGGSRSGTGSRRHSLRPKQPEIQTRQGAQVAVGMLRLHVVYMPSLKVDTESSVWDSAKCSPG